MARLAGRTLACESRRMTDRPTDRSALPGAHADRTIAVGDVHGCRLALDALLAAVAPRPGDVLVFLGDFVDRGPDSRGVLQTVISLTDSCHVVPLMGNHEEMLLQALASDYWLSQWLGFGGRQTLDSYGVTHPSQMPTAHLEFLRNCRPWHETPTHLFFHAGYLPELPPDEQPEFDLRWISLHQGQPGPHVSGKRVVVGHTSQKNGEILDLGHLVCIDTHCYGGGWLTALDVENNTLWQADQQGHMRQR